MILLQKREARAVDNWKSLVKGLLIRQRLRSRYDLQVSASYDNRAIQTHSSCQRPSVFPYIYNCLPVIQMSMFSYFNQFLVAASRQRRPAKPSRLSGVHRHTWPTPVCPSFTVSLKRVVARTAQAIQLHTLLVLHTRKSWVVNVTPGILWNILKLCSCTWKVIEQVKLVDKSVILEMYYFVNLGLCIVHNCNTNNNIVMGTALRQIINWTWRSMFDHYSLERARFL